MEKVVVSLRTGKQVRRKLTAAEQTQRKAENDAFTPKVDEPTLEEVLVEAGVITELEMDTARRSVRSKSRGKNGISR